MLGKLEAGYLILTQMSVCLSVCGMQILQTAHGIGFTLGIL